MYYFRFFGQSDSFRDFLSLLSADVKTLVWTRGGCIMVVDGIIGIYDFRVNTSLFIGAYGAVIHLDIQKRKYKNVGGD
jgi:hypothetical protein